MLEKDSLKSEGVSGLEFRSEYDEIGKGSQLTNTAKENLKLSQNGPGYRQASARNQRIIALHKSCH